MHITWLGSTSIKIQVKPHDKDVTVVIDPYKPATGAFPRSLSPDIGLYTHGEKGSVTLSGDPFTLAEPGECETSGVLITAAQGHASDQVFFRIDAENMSVGHLGNAAKQLTDEQLGALSGVDILCVPVGGKDVYDAEQAVKAINTIEPRVVIPIAFKSVNDPKADDIKVFLKEFGTKETTPEKKVIFKKKHLPQEETQVVILSKE